MQSIFCICFRRYEMKDQFQNINTVVIVGAWNLAIFTPEWVRMNILRDEDYPDVKIMYPLNVLHSLRFSTGKFDFCIGDNRFMFTLTEKNDQAEHDMLNVVSSICQKLPHTPVSALGINFVFETDKNINAVNAIDDTQSLVQSIGLGQTSVEIVRSYKRNDKETLNFKISKIGDNKVKYDINNNYSIRSIQDITEVLNGEDNIIRSKREAALKMLKEVYQEELEA